MFEKQCVDQFKDLYSSVNSELKKDLFDLANAELKPLGSVESEIPSSFDGLFDSSKLCSVLM